MSYSYCIHGLYTRPKITNATDWQPKSLMPFVSLTLHRTFSTAVSTQEASFVDYPWQIVSIKYQKNLQGEQVCRVKGLALRATEM